MLHRIQPMDLLPSLPSHISMEPIESKQEQTTKLESHELQKFLKKSGSNCNSQNSKLFSYARENIFFYSTHIDFTILFICGTISQLDT
ncbi:hypothetical protein BLOT_002042 [Blomia tropicalis]|nr:hypothetical protein BLOT_002042 [Blomia tropicalis]